jgi:hypothetical protein
VTELDILDITWGQAQVLGRDRPKWRKIAVALCPPTSTDEEDEYMKKLYKFAGTQYLNTMVGYLET